MVLVTGKHDTALCRMCRFWSKRQLWCNYSDVMQASRLKAGGKLFPDGGCRLFEIDDSDGKTQQAMKDNWASGKTNGEAYARARAKEIAEKKHSRYIQESVWKQVGLLYSKGYQDNQIAEECGIGKSSVRRWRKRNGLKSNYRLSRNDPDV